jgi:phosphohistidine phosphatase
MQRAKAARAKHPSFRRNRTKFTFMKLYLMRHGPAEDRAASGLDGDRALTISGRERVRAVAKVLAEGGETPAFVVTSPLVRAVQTAEIVAIVTKLGSLSKTVEVRRELSPGESALPWVRNLASDGRKRVLLVGHEPDLSSLVWGLVGRFDRSFEKAMVVALHLKSDAVRAELRFILDPKSLRIHAADE